MAALGLPALLAPGCLAACPRAVAVPMVAATADGKRPPAPPAVAQVQDRSFELGHRSLQRWGLDERCPLVRGSNCQGWASARAYGAGRGTTRKPRRLPGFSFLYPARQSIPPPAPSPPHPLPPRYARDDAASPILDVMVRFLRILVGAYRPGTEGARRRRTTVKWPSSSPGNRGVSDDEAGSARGSPLAPASGRPRLIARGAGSNQGTIVFCRYVASLASSGVAATNTAVCASRTRETRA
jgi:hypothetical protein